MLLTEANPLTVGALLATVAALLDGEQLAVHGPVVWRTKVLCNHPGVYLIALSEGLDGGCAPIDVSHFTDEQRARWLEGQPVIYIGRTRGTLRRRLREFYSHKYGNRSPHRGGQDVLLLPEQRLKVFWAPTNEPVRVEARLIEAFKAHTGHLPFANRVHGTRKPKA